MPCKVLEEILMRIGRFLSVTDVKYYITEYHAPTLLIARDNQSIPNGVNTPISFAYEYYDELNMWAIGDPTNIHTPSDAIWTITIWADWSTNVTGIRRVFLGESQFPYTNKEFVAVNRQYHGHNLAITTHVNALYPVRVYVHQTSGSALNLLSAQILMLRHVIVEYP